MTVELKGTVINMKSLSQNINDPIIVGGSEGGGRWLNVIFTQEAAAQFSEDTRVYLSWRHIQKNVKGYSIFTEVPREDTDLLTAEEQPPVYKIFYPDEMLHEGDVLACIELVDDISVAASVSFTIHVTADPWDGTDWIEQDELKEFKTVLVRAQHLQEIVDNNYDQLNDKIQKLEDMFDLIDFVDENQDGIADTVEVDSGTEIIEWTGGDGE